MSWKGSSKNLLCFNIKAVEYMTNQLENFEGIESLTNP